MNFGTVSPATFVWIIPRIPERFLRDPTNIRSPGFHQQDSSWYFLFSTFCYKDSFKFFLCREDDGPQKTFTYSIKIKGKTKVVEITKTSNFISKIDLIEVQNLKKRALLNSDILITCYIQCDTPNPVAGRDLVTCSVQTEEVPDSISCAIQTEVADSVIEKENPKAKDWSSLDKKGVALLSEHMKDLLNKGIDHDVTICVQDKEFRAHRSILSARSPVFAMMFSHDTKENNTSTINIEDCDPESFEDFLLHMYSGRTENLTPSNALRLYYPADKYDFPVLKERCVSLLKTALSVESICEVVLLAAKHQEKELLEVASEFFARNMEEILVSVSWQTFMAQNPVEANELYIKSMKIFKKSKDL